MKKEIIWNVSLLLFGIMVTLAITLGSINSAVVPGSQASSIFPPFDFWNKLKFGLVVGTLLVIFRYIHIAILAIRNHELRLLILLLSYSIPLLISLLGLHYWEQVELDSMQDRIFPIESIKKGISDLRSAGLFKQYSNMSDDRLAELAIGSTISRQNGFANATPIWNKEENKINWPELLLLDTEKVFAINQGTSGHDDRIFADLIRKMQIVSQNLFVPTEVKVETSNEAIKVSFQEGNRFHTIYPKSTNQALDLETILQYVNQEILSKVDFKYYLSTGTTNFVIGLTQGEQQKLSVLMGIQLKSK